METVEECVVETQAGAQRRRPKRRIEETELRGSLSAIHSVSDVEREPRATLYRCPTRCPAYATSVDFRRRTPSTSTLATRRHSTVASDDAR